jgi:hypothetical protein
MCNIPVWVMTQLSGCRNRMLCIILMSQSDKDGGFSLGNVDCCLLGSANDYYHKEVSCYHVRPRQAYFNSSNKSIERQTVPVTGSQTIQQHFKLFACFSSQGTDQG